MQKLITNMELMSQYGSSFLQALVEEQMLKWSSNYYVHSN